MVRVIACGVKRAMFNFLSRKGTDSRLLGVYSWNLSSSDTQVLCPRHFLPHFIFFHSCFLFFFPSFSIVSHFLSFFLSSLLTSILTEFMRAAKRNRNSNWRIFAPSQGTYSNSVFFNLCHTFFCEKSNPSENSGAIIFLKPFIRSILLRRISSSNNTWCSRKGFTSSWARFGDDCGLNKIMHREFVKYLPCHVFVLLKSRSKGLPCIVILCERGISITGKIWNWFANPVALNPRSPCHEIVW